MDERGPGSTREQLTRLEQAIERWKRKPPSRRQRLILAGYRRAASELRKRIAALDGCPPVPDGMTPGNPSGHPAIGTLTRPTPYRVFRLLSNADAATTDRRAPRAAFRLIEGGAGK